LVAREDLNKGCDGHVLCDRKTAGRNQRRQTARMDDTDYDTLSMSSTASSSDFSITARETDEERDESSLLDAYIESLYEKRLSARTFPFPVSYEISFYASKSFTDGLHL
jgi:hypothetical protein